MMEVPGRNGGVYQEATKRITQDKQMGVVGQAELRFSKRCINWVLYKL